MGTDCNTYVGKLLSCSWLQALTGSIVLVIGAWWAQAPEALKALLIGAAILYISDTVLGITRAWYCPTEKISSSKMSRCFIKFIVYSMSYLAATGLDCALGINAGMQLAVAALIVVREATSCMENSAALGFPWPTWVSERLEGLEKKIEECGRVAEEKPADQESA